MRKHEKTIELLNDLIRIHLDRVNGYEKAAHLEKETDPGTRHIFEKMAMESRSYINELHEEVLHLGGAPVVKSTIVGKIYLFWLSQKAGFVGKDSRPLLAVSEFGEESMQKAYQYALDEGADLPYHITSLISDQKIALKRAYEGVKKYRDSEIISNHHN